MAPDSLTADEIDRLTRATVAYRPEWPLVSLRNTIREVTNANRHRAFADVAHALLAIALDPGGSPTQLAKDGHWWRPIIGREPERPVTTGPSWRPCRVPGHGGHAGDPCSGAPTRPASANRRADAIRAIRTHLSEPRSIYQPAANA